MRMGEKSAEAVVAEKAGNSAGAKGLTRGNEAWSGLIQDKETIRTAPVVRTNHGAREGTGDRRNKRTRIAA